MELGPYIENLHRQLMVAAEAGKTTPGRWPNGWSRP